MSKESLESNFIDLSLRGSQDSSGAYLSLFAFSHLLSLPRVYIVVDYEDDPVSLTLLSTVCCIPESGRHQ